MERRNTSDLPSGFSQVVMIQLAREFLLCARPRLGRPPHSRTRLFEVLGAFAHAMAPVLNNIDSSDRGIMRDWLVNVLDLLVEDLRQRPSTSASEALQDFRADEPKGMGLQSR